MRAELRFSPVPGFCGSFTPKAFIFDQPVTIELEGHDRTTLAPAPNNTVFPSFALTIDQAFVQYTGSAFTLEAEHDLSQDVCVNDKLLVDDAYTLQDGDIVRFGAYQPRKRTFKTDCAARVSILRLPSPSGTNWAGIRDLVDHVRQTTAPPTGISVSASGLPSSPVSSSAPAPTERESSPMVSPSTAAADPSAMPSPTTWDDVLLEMRAFRMKMEAARLREATSVPTSVSGPSRSCSASTLTPTTSTSRSAPSVVTSVPISVLSFSDSTPLPSTPYGDLVQSLRSRISKDATSSLATIVSSVGPSTCKDALVGSSPPSMDAVVVPPLSCPPLCASDPRLQQQLAHDTRLFIDDSATSFGLSAAPATSSHPPFSPQASTSSFSAKSAATALQRVGDALLRARRDVSGLATAMIAVERMREAWRRARGEIESVAPSFVPSGVGPGSRPPPFRAVVEDPFGRPAAVAPIKNDAYTHHPSRSSLSALGRSVPNTLQSLSILSNITPLQEIYQLHASFTALSHRLLSLISTISLPHSFPPAHTFPYHAQPLPHLLGQSCSEALPVLVH